MTATPEKLKERLIDLHKEYNTPNKYNDIGELNLVAVLGEMVMANKDVFAAALDRLISNSDLKLMWGTDYSAEDRETEIQLHVWNPNGAGWFWSAFDAVEEDSCVSVLPGFDTKEAAMIAAENWYMTKWLPKFNETKDRYRAMNDGDN